MGLAVAVRHPQMRRHFNGDTKTTLAAPLQQPSADLHARISKLGCAHSTAACQRSSIVWWSTTSPTCCPLPKMAVRNLAAEGLTERTVHVDDVNTAAVAAMETTDDPARPAAGLQALARCPPSVRLLVHPRLRDRAGRFGISLTNGVLYADEPLPYSA
jgi:hypothetical protein